MNAMKAWIVVRTGTAPGVQAQVARVIGCVLAHDEATAELHAANLFKHPTQRVYCVEYERAPLAMRMRVDALVV